MDKPCLLWSDVVHLGGSSVKQQAARNARRVLIIDDEEGFRDGVADLLGMEGYDVSVARDAVEAVHVLPSFRPEVILLDLRMPHLDGEGFLRGMSGLPASRGVPVVLISAKEDLAAIASRSGAAGVSAEAVRGAAAARRRCSACWTEGAPPSTRGVKVQAPFFSASSGRRRMGSISFSGA